MLPEKFSTKNVMDKIIKGYIKLKPSPCKKCVISITCDKDYNDICDDCLEYDNLIYAIQQHRKIKSLPYDTYLVRFRFFSYLHNQDAEMFNRDNKDIIVYLLNKWIDFDKSKF